MFYRSIYQAICVSVTFWISNTEVDDLLILPTTLPLASSCPNQARLPYVVLMGVDRSVRQIETADGRG
jgi:hypothetical protein